MLLNPTVDSTGNQHVREYVRLQIEKIVGKEKLYSDNLIVQSTIDVAMQHEAQQIFISHVTRLQKTIAPGVEGALLTIDGESGAIRAMMGGVNFAVSQFNRINAKRQFGSIFKPIIYAAALLQGMTFKDTMVDEPLSLEIQGQRWEPHNYDNNFYGCMTLAHALAHSSNIIPLKTLLAMGISPVVDLATRLKVADTIPPYLSLALGCVDGTVMQAAAMFNVFAHNGLYREPYIIEWIKTAHGQKVWEKEMTSQRILPCTIANQVARVLGIGLQRLRMRYANPLSVEAIGKTGTTNECRTCWFAGATPAYTTVVYIGLDNNESMVLACFLQRLLSRCGMNLIAQLRNLKILFL